MPSLLAFGGKRTRHRRDHARLNARPSVWDVSANTSRENGRAPEPAWYPFLEIRSWFGLPVPGPAAGSGSGHRLRPPSIRPLNQLRTYERRYYVPATVMRETRSVGLCTELRVSRSLPTPSMPVHRSSKLIEIVISLTG